MKNYSLHLLIFISVISSNSLFSQNGVEEFGCTNPASCNYNPNATIDDGSCLEPCDCECDNQFPMVTSYIEDIIEIGNIDFTVYIPVYEDNCSETTPSDFTISLMEDIEEIHHLVTPGSGCDVYENPWSMLFSDTNIPDEYGLDQYYGVQNGFFAKLTNGTAFFSGSLYSLENPNTGWLFYLKIENELNYEEWINQNFPTGIKQDCYDASDYFESWLYYILSNESSFLIGFGDYAGSLLNLSHLPDNYYFAYQYGTSANNEDQSFGSGTWAMAEGNFYNQDIPETSEGIEVEASMSLAFKHNICLEDNCCDVIWEVQQTAIDACGNTRNVQIAVNQFPNCLNCPGDVTNDNTVNVIDLLTVSADWGCISGCTGDADNNGIVNIIDFLIVSANYGIECSD